VDADVEERLRPAAAEVDVLVVAKGPRRRLSKSLTPRWPTTSRLARATLKLLRLAVRKELKRPLSAILPWTTRCFEQPLRSKSDSIWQLLLGLAGSFASPIMLFLWERLFSHDFYLSTGSSQIILDTRRLISVHYHAIALRPNKLFFRS
jgi:hypothetical protein